MGGKQEHVVPLRMAALPDLMARLAILAMTSGRASNMMSRTPIGHETRSSIKLSSSFVRICILPTSHGYLFRFFSFSLITSHTWVVQIPNIQYPLEHILPLALLSQIQPRDQRIAQRSISGGFLGELEITRVGGQDLVLGGSESGMDGIEGGIAGGCGEGG